MRKRSKNDVTYYSHAYLATDVFSALALVQVGINTNSKVHNEAGRKTIFPFMGQLNHIDYFQGMFRDFVEHGYGCPPCVRAEQRANFSYGQEETNKQSIDFMTEKVIKLTKPLLLDDTIEGFECAAVLYNAQNSLRYVVLSSQVMAFKVAAFRFNA